MGIFVNEPQDHIVSLVNHGVIQIIQLHGQESEDYITSLREKTGCPVIRVVSVRSTEDIIQAERTSAEFLLLDNGRGGTGKSFNWKYIPALKKPWFLAGGIGLDNLKEALALHPCLLYTSVGGPGTTAALALLNDAVKKGGLMEMCIRDRF